MKTNPLPFINVSKLLRYLLISDSKCFSVISFALPLIMISLLPLLCYMLFTIIFIIIFRRNNTVIVDWSFQLSDFFRLFVSFKYGLILLRYSFNWWCSFITSTFIFNIIVITKLFTLTVLYIPLIVASFVYLFCFFNLERFLASLIVFFWYFYILQALDFVSLVFFKIKIYYSP